MIGKILLDWLISAVQVIILTHQQMPDWLLRVILDHPRYAWMLCKLDLICLGKLP